MPCGLSRSKSACDVAILVAVGIPDECAEDGSVGELGAVGVGTVEMALPIRDLGFLAATSLLGVVRQILTRLKAPQSHKSMKRRFGTTL